VTGYARAAAEGRANAHTTNTSFKMRTIVEYREVTRTVRGRDTRYGQLVGNCGHVVDEKIHPQDWFAKRVGTRKRCQRCPADPPRPIPVDHCTYGIGTEFGERPCPTRAKFNDVGNPGYGLLCTKHHNYLLRNDYLDQPVARYVPPPGPVQYLPATPPPAPATPPVLSPPVRGHLRLVVDNG
jgi:hypothetical protein